MDSVFVLVNENGHCHYVKFFKVKDNWMVVTDNCEGTEMGMTIPEARAAYAGAIQAGFKRVKPSSDDILRLRHFCDEHAKMDAELVEE